MAKVVLDVSELGNLKRALAPQSVNNMLSKLAFELMHLVYEVARENTPVLTGELRSGWEDAILRAEVSREGNVYTVSIENYAYQTKGHHPNPENRFYASFVEEGYHSKSGRWIPGHWMMATGEAEAERKAQSMFDAIILDWWHWCNASGGRVAKL